MAWHSPTWFLSGPYRPHTLTHNGPLKIGLCQPSTTHWTSPQDHKYYFNCPPKISKCNHCLYLIVLSFSFFLFSTLVPFVVKWVPLHEQSLVGSFFPSWSLHISALIWCSDFKLQTSSIKEPSGKVFRGRVGELLFMWAPCGWFQKVRELCTTFWSCFHLKSRSPCE